MMQEPEAPPVVKNDHLDVKQLAASVKAKTKKRKSAQ
jgi:hypothetical protein